MYKMVLQLFVIVFASFVMVFVQCCRRKKQRIILKKKDHSTSDIKMEEDEYKDDHLHLNKKLITDQSVEEKDDEQVNNEVLLKENKIKFNIEETKLSSGGTSGLNSELICSKYIDGRNLHSVYLMDTNSTNTTTSDNFVGHFHLLGATVDNQGCIMNISTWQSESNTEYTVYTDSSITFKQSIEFAQEFVKKHAEKCKVVWPSKEYKILTKISPGDIHKSGYSGTASIIIVTIALLRKRQPIKGVTITGDVEINGLMSPVAGILSKLNIARKVNLHHIVLPDRLKPIVDELTKYEKQGFNFTFVKTLFEALPIFFPEE